MRFEELPLDLLIDTLLLCLDLPSLLALSATSKAFYKLIISQNATADLLWKARIAQDLNFPVSNTARASQWLDLYKKVLSPQLFAWGAAMNDRLGITRGDPLASKLIGGGLPQPGRMRPTAGRPHIIDIEASGWASHALDTKGRVWAAGMLDGGGWAPPDAPWSDPYAAIVGFQQAPRDFPSRIKTLAAGRAHVIAQDQRQRVYEWRSFGRVARIYDSDSKWRLAEQVTAGWDFSAILARSESGQLEAFIHFAPAYVEVIEASSRNPQFGSEGYEVPTAHFDMPIHSVRLPVLPLPSDRIAEIAAGDNFLVALSANGGVFKLDVSPVAHQHRAVVNEVREGEGRSELQRQRLEAAFVSGERSWVYLPEFSEMTKLQQHPTFTDRPIKAQRISHISAHFQTFVAYAVDSVKENGIVLIGDREATGNSRPEALPALQGIGVIKVVMGDYHKGALTSDGHLLTWGQYSSGALGHGHKNGRLGDIARERTHGPRTDADDFGRNQFDLTEPTKVDFSISSTTAGKSDYFVFNASFSGWHSLALAVNLDPQSEEQASSGIEEEEEPAHPMPGHFSTRPPVTASQARRGRIFNPRNLRVGFPARGAMRGGWHGL